MRRFSILHPIWMAFYDGEIYVDVARHWRKLTFLYILLLLALTWIPFTIRTQNQIEKWISQEAPYYIDQIPELTLAEGELSTSSSTPTFLHDREGSVLLVIDPTGQHTSLNDTTAPILISRTQIFVRGEGGHVDIQSLPDSPAQTLTREDLYVFSDWIRALVNMFLFPALVVVSYMYRMLQVLLYAYVASFFSMSGGPFPYRTLLNLTIIAITPAVVLDAVHMLMGSPLPDWFWWPACVLLSLGYLRFGMRVSIESDTQVSG